MVAYGRPSFDETFVEIAEVLSRRGTCPRLQVGAVIVDERNRVVGSGYNGAATHLQHCSEGRCQLEDNHCIRAIHAEINAVLNATDLAQAREGAMYVWGGVPCYRCAQAIISVGINRVLVAGEVPEEYRQGHGPVLLREAGISCEFFSIIDGQPRIELIAIG
jgi:dCMP deaminase